MEGLPSYYLPDPYHDVPESGLHPCILTMGRCGAALPDPHCLGLYSLELPHLCILDGDYGL